MSDVNVQRRETQIENIRFDNLQTTNEISLIAHRDFLKHHVLANASSTRNILISKERLLFVTTRSLESNLKKAKCEESIKSQTLYHDFMSLN